MAVAEAVKEALWLTKLVKELGIEQGGVGFHCDSQSTIYLAKNQVYHARTKHIEVHYHYVREKVLLGLIDLVYVSTEDQVADIFMKALGAEKLRKFKDLLGVQELGLS